jgi:hypothetical protein
MKLGLFLLALALIAPLIWLMSDHGPAVGSFGRGFGVSGAIWLTLGHMALFVALCAVILAADRPEGSE